MNRGFNASALLTPIRGDLGDGSRVGLHRLLVVANQTLDNPALIAAVRERCGGGSADVRVLVPQPRRILPFVDPVMGVSLEVGVEALVLEQQELDEAEARLAAFLAHFADLGSAIRGEVVLGDPVAAARRLGGSAIDEIIVSTLPPGLSRWLRMDLPARLSRAFDRPVTALVGRP